VAVILSHHGLQPHQLVSVPSYARRKRSANSAAAADEVAVAVARAVAVAVPVAVSVSCDFGVFERGECEEAQT
jgi:hypothetical protein